MAWHTLELKSSKNRSSSIADDTLVGPFPFESTRIAFSWLVMFCCIFNKQRLKPAAWLHMTVDSRADFSHLRRFSCEMGRDMGGALAIPACLAILRYVLLSWEDPVHQDVTVCSESFLGLA